MKLKNIYIALLIAFTAIGAVAQTSFVAEMKDGRNNARFESDAPLENIVGTTNMISAMLTLDTDDVTKSAKGKVVVNLKSLKTGIDLRDKHMRSEDYLHTDRYPDARTAAARSPPGQLGRYAGRSNSRAGISPGWCDSRNASPGN